MTDAQQQALQKAYLLLGEHFDRAVIVVDWEVPADMPITASKMVFKGGRLPALGMLEWGSDQIKDGDRWRPGE